MLRLRNNRFSQYYVFKLIVSILVLTFSFGCTQTQPQASLFESAGEEAKPWTFWYWMHGEVSKEGITADLEAMKEIGLEGAYLFYIKDLREEPLIENPVRTLSPEWWEMVRFAVQESKRLGLKLGMHSCDGFTCAGGPWITPEKSMQKVVWADTIVDGGSRFDGTLPVPYHKENYYEDIVTYAYPVKENAGQSSFDQKVKVTTDVSDVNLQYLAEKGNTKQFKSKKPCYIQFEFEELFTCRSVEIQTGWYNYHSNRFLIQVSNDGKQFTDHYQMKPPRSGWEDLYANATTLIPEVTANYFRFVYDPAGMDAGAEDLDAAKWNPSLRIKGIELSSDPKIHQFEGKSAAIWRIAKRTTNEEDLSKDDCVALNSMIELSDKVSKDGYLNWKIPAGKWRILRMGHTSTGTKNYVGGAGKGLECDKLNPEVVQFQFDQWFGEIFRQVGPDLAGDVLKRFHVDSWECGTQNWSPVLRKEFKKRRGYDYYPYLPVMAGVPVENAEISERVLADLRETIAEMVVDNFFGILSSLAHEKDCRFSAESVSPIMVADGMAHFREVDLPMGEFWYRSPSHDKPNDILDAISGAHLYGKNIVQSESLTAIRLDWNEHPALLKPVVDRNFALGINKIFFHVFTHNPWVERKPGMTLDVIGTYFQRNQTWWKQGRAFIDYLTNCQVLLQKGKPVTDIAVFTGEEVPRRSILPDRLVPILPGIMGKERVQSENYRLNNNDFATRQIPDGVTTLENMADPWEWINPLKGYAYDSFNKDALLRLASVKNGRIVLPGGASYKILVIPGSRRMAPDGNRMSLEVAKSLLELVEDGATILISDKPNHTPGLNSYPENEQELTQIINQLYAGEKKILTDEDGNILEMWQVGKGRVLQAPYYHNTFDVINLPKDFIAKDTEGNEAKDIAWNHRAGKDFDSYFVSNQLEESQELNLSFRVTGKQPELYNPLNGEVVDVLNWNSKNGLTELPVKLEGNESVFIVFHKSATTTQAKGSNWKSYKNEMDINGTWSVQFNTEFGGPENPIEFAKLTDWNQHNDPGVRYYSGTATYKTTFNWEKSLDTDLEYWLNFGRVENIAELTLNGVPLGISWTKPYRLNLKNALKAGKNELQISVTNTWANRLIGDNELPEDQRVTWTTAPYRLKNKPLLPAGLLGPVTIESTTK